MEIHKWTVDIPSKNEKAKRAIEIGRIGAIDILLHLVNISRFHG